MVRAGEPPAPATSPLRSRVTAALGGVDVPAATQHAAILERARLRRRAASPGRAAELAAGRRRPGRPGRGSRPHRRLRQGPVTAAAARRRRASRRRRRRRSSSGAAPRGGGARARRGGHLELHLREEAALFGGGAWRLANPISEEMKVMRPSLLPGLIAAARRNLDRGAATVRLFESAAATLPTASVRRGLPDRRRMPRVTGNGQGADFDAFDAKAEVLALLEAAGAPVANLQVFMDAGPTWHPGRSATLGLGRRPSSPRSASFTRGLLADLPADGRRRALSRRDPGAALGGRARPAFAAGAAVGHARFRFLRPAGAGRRRPGPGDPRRRQGGDHRCAAVRPLRPGGGLSLAIEVDAAAGREELHRGRDRRHLEANRRRGREVRRAAPEASRGR